MLSTLFAISYKFSGTSEKFQLNSFCYFLFLNYGKKSQNIASNTLNAQSKSKNFLQTSSLLAEKQLQKQFFGLKFNFSTISLDT